MRKVAVVTGTRAEWGLLRPVCEAIRAERGLSLQVVAGGAHLLAPARTIDEVAEDLPSTVLEPGEPGSDGIALLDLLPRTSLAASKREARDFLQAGAVSVNGTRAAPDARIGAADLLHGRVALLRRGKKQWHAIRPAGG